MLRTLLILVALAPLGAGCVAVAAAGVVGVGLVQYHRNEAQRDFPADLRQAWQATLEGLRRLEIVPDQSELTSTEGRIERDGLQVFVERHPEGFTRVRVRVGAFHSADHQRRALLVLQEIEGVIAGQDELRAWVEKVNTVEEIEPPAQPGRPKR